MGPLAYEPVAALILTRRLLWMIAPPNVLIGLLLGTLFGINVALGVYGLRCARACGARSAAAFAGVVPGLLRPFAGIGARHECRAGADRDPEVALTGQCPLACGWGLLDWGRAGQSIRPSHFLGQPLLRLDLGDPAPPKLDAQTGSLPALRQTEPADLPAGKPVRRTGRQGRPRRDRADDQASSPSPPAIGPLIGQAAAASAINGKRRP